MDVAGFARAGMLAMALNLAMGAQRDAQALAAASPLSPGAPVSGRLIAGATDDIALESTPGDYIEGWLESGATPLDLSLLDAAGRPVRRLLESATGKSVFRFVAESTPLSLRVSGHAGGSFTLGLRLRVGLAQQVPPTGHLSPAIARAAQAVAAGAGTDAFWREVAERGTPLVEPSDEPGHVLLTFVARGAKRNVRLLGGPANDHVFLGRLGDSDIWFKSFVVPDTTRLSYQIAPDIPDIPGSAQERRRAILATAQGDPFNKHPWPADAPDRFNQESHVELPAAPPQPGLEPDDAARTVPRGRLSTHPFTSARLGNEREITIYRPHGFDPADPRNVLLLVFDGDEYRSKVPTPRILDVLIAEGRLPPVVAVFIPNPDRAARIRELPANPAFAAMLAEELLPFVAERTGLKPQAARTVLAGSSFGGLAAATAALAYPDMFGNAIAMSGSFWWHPPESPPDQPEYVAGRIVHGPDVPVRFFLSAGLFERGRGDTEGILETTRHLRDVLQAKNYDVMYRDYAAGHDYFAWRGILGDGLIALFGTPAPAPGR